MLPETHRSAQAVSQLVGQGELDLSRWQQFSIVLNGDQARVEGGGLAIAQGGGLGADPPPVTWRTDTQGEKG